MADASPDTPVDPEDLDNLTREQLAELDGPAASMAFVLDDWLIRRFGKESSHHGAGLFLDLLAAEGYRVTKIEAPDLDALLPTGPLRGEASGTPNETGPRTFWLQRHQDVTGASGTGHVADGVLWTDGTVTIKWLGEYASEVSWPKGLEAVERIHGHDGRTRVVWYDEGADRG